MSLWAESWLEGLLSPKIVCCKPRLWHCRLDDGEVAWKTERSPRG